MKRKKNEEDLGLDEKWKQNLEREKKNMIQTFTRTYKINFNKDNYNWENYVICLFFFVYSIFHTKLSMNI